MDDIIRKEQLVKIGRNIVKYVHCDLADVIITQIDSFQRLVGSIESLETGTRELIVAQVDI